MSGQTGARYLRAHPTFIMCLQQVIMKLRQQDIMVHANIQYAFNLLVNRVWSDAMAHYAIERACLSAKIIIMEETRRNPTRISSSV